MRRHRSDFVGADWLDRKGGLKRDILKLGDLLKCRYWLLLEHVMSDKRLLLMRRMMRKRKMKWLVLLLLGFLELDHVRPTHILEK